MPLQEVTFLDNLNMFLGNNKNILFTYNLNKSQSGSLISVLRFQSWTFSNTSTDFIPNQDTITRHRRGYPKVIINVGGERHEIMWKLLEAKPLSRKVSYVYMYLYTWDVTCFDWIKKIRKKFGLSYQEFFGSVPYL